MKICIDGFSITHLLGTGLYTYTNNMLENLFKLYPQPKYKIIWDKSTYLPKWSKFTNIDLIYLNLNRTKNNYSELETFISDNNINIYHSPNNGFSIPSKKLCKQVITIHELLPALNKDYVDKKYFTKFHNMYPCAIEKSDKIIAVSNYIKEQLISIYNVSPEKIHVIYPGISNIFKPLDEEKCKIFLERNYHVKNDYILFVGAIHPRKNLEILIEVFKYVKRYHSKLNLVIVGNYDGKRKDYYLKLKALSGSLHVEDSIIFTGFVDHEHMPYFYNASRCVINLSEYEGFPLSTVEALSCNKIVVCNNSSIFQEILGNYTMMINLKDKNELKDMILSLLDDNIIHKNSIYENSIQDISRYNWDNSVRSIVKVYEDIGF